MARDLLETPEWKRARMVLQVQAGELSVTEACEALGISRPHYYEMEERVMAAALAAAAPRKPGPKEKGPEEKAAAELEERLRKAEGDRAMLALRVKHLEEMLDAIRERVLGEAKKKGGHGGPPA
jgi:hypothetical protein